MARVKMCFLRQSWIKIDKFTKLNTIDFYTECTTANFLRFSGKHLKICFSGGRVGIQYQIRALQGFFGIFLFHKFLKIVSF